MEKKFKQKIFWSSAKYAVGVLLFPIYYLILTFLIYKILGSVLSALIFLISFPIAGNIAFYYWFDLKKWFSVLRFKNLKKVERMRLVELRDGILHKLSII